MDNPETEAHPIEKKADEPLLKRAAVTAVVLGLAACDDETTFSEDTPVGSQGYWNRVPQEVSAPENTQGMGNGAGNVNNINDTGDFGNPGNGGVPNSATAVDQNIGTTDLGGDFGTQNAPPQRFASLVPSFNGRISLRTTGMTNTDRITLSDGANINVLRFFSNTVSGFNSDRLFPAPCIELIQGTTVELELISGSPHTIHLHGLDVDQANDGVPATSGYVADASSMGTGRVVGYPRLTSPFTYVFNTTHAGTYIYHCHVDTVLHMEMGMSGTIIVRPPDGNRNMLWQNGPTFDREYVWHLHTFDSTWHTYTMSNPNGTSRYRPNYFFINGMEGPNLLNDPVTVVHALPGETVLIRAVNIGYMPANINLGGIPFRIVSSDGRPLAREIQTNNYLVAPGERYDVLLTMPAAVDAPAYVEYYNIMGTRILGTAQTRITSV